VINIIFEKELWMGFWNVKWGAVNGLWAPIAGAFECSKGKLDD